MRPNKGPSGYEGLLMLGLSWCWMSCQPGTDDLLSTFVLHPEFEIQLVASEPLIFDPVDLEFDEKGDAYVIEMPGYPIPGDESGRLVSLLDQDNDGLYDHRVIVSQNLGIATSLMPYRGGFLVAAPPDLLFIQDQDGDGKEDYREVILSGFSVGNTQHNFNGLQYGLDNWIYGANGGNSGEIYWPANPEPKFPIRGQDFRINLSTTTFERYGRTSGGFELGFDDWGRIYCDNYILHITHRVFPGSYLEDLPISPSHGLHNISNHNEGTELTRIYPIGEQVTRLNHPEQSGYFSGACGIMAYTGGNFPPEFDGNVFVADVVLNLIHRDVISPDNSTIQASRAREKVEFLASSDRSFRPVNMTVGPDGAIYLLDMHRTIIEHPEWIPDDIEKELDLNQGRDKGRVYRIVPRGGLSWPEKDLSKMKTGELVQQLTEANRWFRLTAQRLMVERQSTDAIPGLRELLANSRSVMGRLHALYTLDGLQALDQDDLLSALVDRDEGIREHAIRLSEPQAGKWPPVLSVIVALADDSSARVRNQVALSLGRYNTGDPLIAEAIASVAHQGFPDPWTRVAVVSGARNLPLPILGSVLHPVDSTQVPGQTILAKSLATLVGRNADEASVQSVLNRLDDRDLGSTLVASVLDGLADGWDNPDHEAAPEALIAKLNTLESRGSLPVMASAWKLRRVMNLGTSPGFEPTLQKAKTVVADRSQSTQRRLEFLGLLEFGEFEDRESLLFDLLDNREPAVIQNAAMEQLGQARNRSVALSIIERWKNLSPEVRTAAGNVLLYQPHNHDLLLTALEQGDLKLGELNLHLERRRVLLWSENPSVRSRAEALFSDSGVLTRKEAMNKMRKALSISGDVASGKEVFTSFCSSCHRVGDNGIIVGPDLTEIFRKSKESIMHDILDPNAACNTEYLSHTAHLVNGDIINGIVSAESDQTITLKEVGGKERVISRDEVRQLSSEGLSLMPEGFEQLLDDQQMADLLAYLQEYR